MNVDPDRRTEIAGHVIEHPSYTKLDPTFHNLVVYNKTAERAYARFKVGDQYVASGYINEYEVDRHGHTVTVEEFVARRIGHDLARTRHDVDRTPSRQPDPPAADVSAAKEAS